MAYIKNHKYSIEEKAKKHYGTTDVFELAGYLLEDGTMLDFSEGGDQREQDHRNIGFFYSKASGTKALIKFMNRGNIRVMCNENGYRFEYIKKPTKKQLAVIKNAGYLALRNGIYFTVEKDDHRGNPIKEYYNVEEISEFVLTYA